MGARMECWGDGVLIPSQPYNISPLSLSPRIGPGAPADLPASSLVSRRNTPARMPALPAVSAGSPPEVRPKLEVEAFHDSAAR
jgi:hypothetical protein